jgi:MSHA biogenesis protein MshI
MLGRRAKSRGIQVGLHLQPDGIALVCTQPLGAGARQVSSCAFRACAPDAHVAELARAVDELGLRGLPCTAVLSPGEYALRAVEAPAVPEAELRAALRWSLAELVEMDLEDAVVDAIGVPVRERRGRGRLVYAIAAPKPRMREIARLVEHAGLRLEAIDIAELALRNLVAHSPADPSGVLTLAVYERVASLAITRESTLYVARWADADLDALAGELGKAEGELLGGEFAGPELDALVLEIQRSLDYYHHELGQRPAGAVLLAPLRVQVEELPQRIGAALGLEVGWLAPEELIECAEPVHPDRWACCATALGAALRAPEAAP